VLSRRFALRRTHLILDIFALSGGTLLIVPLLSILLSDRGVGRVVRVAVLELKACPLNLVAEEEVLFLVRGWVVNPAGADCICLVLERRWRGGQGG